MRGPFFVYLFFVATIISQMKVPHVEKISNRRTITIIALLSIWWCIVLINGEDGPFPSSILGWLIIGVIKTGSGFFIMGWFWFAWLLIFAGFVTIRFAFFDTFFGNGRMDASYVQPDFGFRLSLIVGLISNLYVLVNLSIGRESFTLFESYTICLPFSLSTLLTLLY